MEESWMESAASRGRRRTVIVGVALVSLFLFALFLRAYFNVPVIQRDGEFVLPESDSYYHKRTVDHILATERQLIWDPMLNYPHGDIDPNPPFYDWQMVFSAKALAATGIVSGIDEAAWWATVWSPAVWAALTVFPAYLVARSAFASRKAGLAAAFFMATSMSHIERTELAYADHDAAVLFFIVLTIAFFVRSLALLRPGVYVEKWGDGDGRRAGLSRFVSENKPALYMAGLAGVAHAGVALTWKGFPYVTGILFVTAALYLLIAHTARREGFGVFSVTFIALLLGVLLPIPYYNATTFFSALYAPFYMTAIFVVFGAVFLLARNYPTILVVPAFLLALGVGVAAAFFVLPEVATTLLYNLVYFRQTKLYTTIAEAHPSEFQNLIFASGYAAFLLTIWGLVHLLIKMRKTWEPQRLAVFVWVLVATYMAMQAARFLFNATPAFSVMGGWVVAMAVDRLRLQEIGRTVASMGDVVLGLRRGTRTGHVVGVLLVASLVVFPNVFMAVDAGMTSEAESRYIDAHPGSSGFISKRFGAFGGNYIQDYWFEELNWFCTQDLEIEDPAMRPAFLSWWDYGHWTAAAGCHPTVADNFQNGFFFAGNFIASRSETHATQLLAARLLESVKIHTPSSDVAIDESDVAAKLEELGVPAGEGEAAVETLFRFEPIPALDLEDSAALLAWAESSTGKKIRYFAVDVRMFPFDNPAQPGIEQSSILYAPLSLAEKTPEDYFETIFIDQSGRPYTQSEYLAEQTIDPSTGQGRIQVTDYQLRYKAPFFDSMFYRTYVGTPPQSTRTGQLCAEYTETPTAPQLARGDEIPGLLCPAMGLTHWRTVYVNSGLRMIAYTPGAVVTGRVTLGSEPLAGVDVTVFDDAGDLTHTLLSEDGQARFPVEEMDVPHATTQTGEDGSYRLLVPFSTGPRGIRVEVSRNGAEIGNFSFPVSRAEAERGATVGTGRSDVSVAPAVIDAVTYLDVDGDQGFDPAVDRTLGGVTLTLEERTVTSADDGSVRIEGVVPGRFFVNAAAEGYEYETSTGILDAVAGETVTAAFGFRPARVPMNGTAWADRNGNGAIDPIDGEPLAGTALEFTRAEAIENNTAEDVSVETDADGRFTASLRPGVYTVRGQATGDGATFRLEEVLVVGIGQEPFTKDLEFRRA
ncbi:MAG: STT3 domain-containing protein [Methanobacteriota archaeon]